MANDDRLAHAKKLLRERNYDEAIATLEAILAEDPDSPAMVQNLGTACFAAQRYDDAIKHFEHLVRLKPNEVTAFVNLGAVLNRVGKFRKASDTLRRAVQRDRKCAAAYYNLGIAYRGDGNNAMCVSSYKEALRLDPDMVDAHYNLANVYVDMGNHQQAIVHYKEALTRKPDFTKAERGLAKAEQAAAEAKQAFSPFGRLVEPKKPTKAEDKPADKSGTKAVVLSEQQRVEDRNKLCDLGMEARTSLESLIASLRERFDAAVTALNKVVSQGKKSSHLLDESHEEFQQALAEVRAAWTAILRTTTAIRRHEAILAAAK